MIADMALKHEAARLLTFQAARFKDKGVRFSREAAMAKLFASESAMWIATKAIQVHGGYGFTDEFAVSRFFRGARYGSLGGGTTETLRNLVARKLVEDLDLATGCFGMGTF